MITRGDVDRHFAALAHHVSAAAASDLDGKDIPLEQALGAVLAEAMATHARGNKVIFVGNGGSAGISSHMAIDWSKNGGIRAQAFNDGAALTCLGNDYGYEHVFAKQIEFHARPGDMLIAISSSGRSPNILAACAAMRTHGGTILTLSGFAPDNPLRRAGDINLFVGSGEYGFVEMGHLILLHTIVDFAMRARTGS